MISWLVNKGYFRNENHAIWFLCSLGLLVFVTLVYIKPSPEILLLMAVVIHIPPFLTSIFVTKSNRESVLYSKDCIYFNAIMVLLYFGLFYYFKFV